MVKNTKEMKFDVPIKLLPTRVWRTYKGGKMLDEFHGEGAGDDGNFPEEWIISIVTARNTGREGLIEGLSFLDGSDANLKQILEADPIALLGKEHVDKIGMKTGVLVKLIDSAERLTIQVHPDKEKARNLFHSEFGKTECWHILGTRTINNEKPCIYLGFKPNITRDYWQRVFDDQDIPNMLNCLNRFEVEIGDTFLINGGVPHAIGAGCFLIEIQEPTDYSIRTERVTPSGFQISDFMCHQGIGFKDMFECFTYEGYSSEETYNKWHINPIVIKDSPDYREIELIGYDSTPNFKMKMYEVTKSCEVETLDSFSGLFVFSGNCTLQVNDNEQEAKQGDQFFVPASINKYQINNKGNEPARIFQFFGPDIKQ